ncbi:MAG: acyltransferase [Planctomycetota bacterium]
MKRLSPSVEVQSGIGSVDPCGAGTASHSQCSQNTRPSRNAGLDAARGLACLLVVLLHAGVPYAKHPMPGLAWVTSGPRSSAVDVGFWAIEIFIMPLFLLLAGYFAASSFARTPPLDVLKSRLKRLGRPLLFGCLVILPIDFYLWAFGWALEGWVPFRKLRSLKFDAGIDAQLWGTAHLWFLVYLLTYIGLTAIAFRVFRRASLKSPACGIGILASVAIATVCVRPAVIWGFQHAILPVPSKWLYSFCFFLGGMLVQRFDPNWTTVLAGRRRMAGVGIVTSAMAIVLAFWSFKNSGAIDGSTSEKSARVLATGAIEQLTFSGDTKYAAMCLACLSVAAATTISLSFVAFCQIWTRRSAETSIVRRSLAYLASASLWVYLVHHPLVGLVHLSLRWLAPQTMPVIQCVVAFSLATLVSLLTYEVLARRSRLGAWLDVADRSLQRVQNALSDDTETTLPASIPFPIANTEPDFEEESRRAA